MSLETADDLDWRADAACREYPPEMWFPEKGQDGQAARLICLGCPVKLQCLTFSLSLSAETVGIFGGLGRDQRKKINPRRAVA